MQNTDAIIIGAAPAGLACAAGGLYFCCEITVPTGQLREIGIEARRIADHAAVHKNCG